MITTTITFHITMMYFVAANIIAILIYVLMIKSRTRQQKRHIAILTAVINQYFDNAGVDISVRCACLENSRHFSAFIDSRPTRRFRLSHMLELALREHVREATGLKLDTVYWRFIASDEHSVNDEYVRDGLSLYDVEDSTLEMFEELRQNQNGNTAAQSA